MARPDRFSFGDFVLERSQQRLLQRDGTPVNLSPRLFNALLLFVEHAGCLLDKDTLMKALWPGLVVEENNLSQVVSALRRVLGEEAQGRRFIETVPRRGFRFVAPVQALPAADATAASAPGPSPAVAPAFARARVEAPSAAVGRRQWLRLALGTGAAAGLVGAGWWAWQRRPLPVQAAPDNSLAVLPFRPLLGEARDELLELGLADSLIAQLSTVPGLVVRSTGSVTRYAGTAQEPLLAARELQVGWVVDGTLQRRGDRLRATARLLSAADGSAVWSGSFDEPLSDIFGMQDRISTRMKRAMVPALSVTASVRTRRSEIGGPRSAEAD